MVQFMCSNCGRSSYLPDNFAHLRVKCPNCSTFIIVPEASEQIVLATPAEDQQDPSNYGLD